MNIYTYIPDLSRPYLSRIIKKETGHSLVELIDTYRIEEDKYLLQQWHPLIASAL